MLVHNKIKLTFVIFWLITNVQAQTPNAPLIDIWYGENQTFDDMDHISIGDLR